mgnify:CR=1 FL=1
MIWAPRVGRQAHLSTEHVKGQERPVRFIQCACQDPQAQDLSDVLRLFVQIAAVVIRTLQ